MSILSNLYVDNEIKISMQFLADVIRKMSERKLITKKDLYTLSEKEIIEKIKNCKEDDISRCFQLWENTKRIGESETFIDGKYFVSVKGKLRYIVPLVRRENKFFRINQLSEQAKECIETVLNFETKKYAYLDFQF